jgi:ethanolamine utilization protein EutN
MFLGRVLGDVVATIKHPALAGRTLLLVQPLTPTGEAKGAAVIALDATQAGVGDHVLVLDEGNGAAQVFGRPRGPVRSVVVGVVDEVTQP